MLQSGDRVCINTSPKQCQWLNLWTDTDKQNCLLVSRLACNGKMLHPLKGYSGPLSRHLLAYQSLVSSIRSSLRDLVEMCLAVLFLEGRAERIREDLLEISNAYPLPLWFESD